VGINYTILTVSVLVVGIILRPGKFPGNSSLKNEIEPSFPLWCEMEFSVAVRRNCCRHQPHLLDLLMVHIVFKMGRHLFG
jgi:hypothetical protein